MVRSLSRAYPFHINVYRYLSYCCYPIIIGLPIFQMIYSLNWNHCAVFLLLYFRLLLFFFLFILFRFCFCSQILKCGPNVNGHHNQWEKSCVNVMMKQWQPYHYGLQITFIFFHLLLDLYALPYGRSAYRRHIQISAVCARNVTPCVEM